MTDAYSSTWAFCNLGWSVIDKGNNRFEIFYREMKEFSDKLDEERIKEILGHNLMQPYDESGK